MIVELNSLFFGELFITNWCFRCPPHSMAYNTRMKDLQAKVETLFMLMEHNEQIFKTIEQSLTNLQLIQQSIARISQMIKSNQILKTTEENSTTPTLIEDFLMNQFILHWAIIL